MFKRNNVRLNIKKNSEKYISLHNRWKNDRDDEKKSENIFNNLAETKTILFH
jgi:hypothetical protein